MRAGVRGLLVAAALVAAACSGGSAASSSAAVAGTGASPAPASLTIFGAASLKAVLLRVRAAYEPAHPGTTLTISTDSSAALETQLEQGAPADVFLSADTANPEKLVARGLAAGPVVAFARNLLTVIAPQGNPAAIVSPADLARPGVKVVAAGEAVPITRYAEKLVSNLGRQPGYPSDFAARYEANVVSREDNVAAVVAKIELGEGDAAICYVTDAKTSTKVRTIDVPNAANVPATYGAVVVGASHDRPAAQAFVAWLAGPDGQAILRSFGFLPTS